MIWGILPGHQPWALEVQSMVLAVAGEVTGSVVAAQAWRVWRRGGGSKHGWLKHWRIGKHHRDMGGISKFGMSNKFNGNASFSRKCLIVWGPITLKNTNRGKTRVGLGHLDTVSTFVLVVFGGDRLHSTNELAEEDRVFFPYKAGKKPTLSMELIQEQDIGNIVTCNVCIPLFTPSRLFLLQTRHCVFFPRRSLWWKRVWIPSQRWSSATVYPTSCRGSSCPTLWSSTTRRSQPLATSP